MTTIGRNAPCPCGSGKRFKNCHGAVGSSSSNEASETVAKRTATMHAALDYQRRGELGSAKILYEEVLEDDPNNFDVLHMLGVVEYQRKSYYRAEQLILRALEVSPYVEAAQSNLALVRASLGLERELCKSILSHLAQKHANRAAPIYPHPVQFVICRENDGERHLARQCRGSLEAAMEKDGGLPVWTQQPDGSVASRIPIAGAPTGGTIVFVGTHFVPGEWIKKAAAEHIVLICDESDVCEIHDRLLAATCELQTPVSLLYLSSGVAREVPWTGLVIACEELTVHFGSVCPS